MALFGHISLKRFVASSNIYQLLYKPTHKQINIYINLPNKEDIMQAINSYSRASHNGIVGESIAESILHVPVNPTAILDIIPPQGPPVEVKTCQIWVKTAHTDNQRRRGRYNLVGSQHRALCERGGYYLFILLDEDEKPIAASCLPASAVYHPSLQTKNTRVSLCWSSVIPPEVA